MARLSRRLSAHDVEERTLPAGDDRTLSRVCGELYCQLIDRTRPPWQLTVLHGYRGGTVVFLKLHHTMVDGVASVELIEMLHSAQPGTLLPPPHAGQWQPRPVPGLVDRLRGVAADQITAGLDATRVVVDLVRPGAVGALAVRSAMAELKRRRQADGIHEVIAGANWWPAPLYRLVWKLWPRGYFPLHITSTNVPGPRQPLCPGPEAGWRAVRSQ